MRTLVPGDRGPWPTRRYVHGAIDILEQLHLATGDVSAVPSTCRESNWRFPQLVYDMLKWWAIDLECAVAIVGFAVPPEIIFLGWILEHAGIGSRNLAGLILEDRDFLRVTVACGRIARCKAVVINEGHFTDPGKFDAAVLRLNTEWGVTRILAQDQYLGSGRRLSELTHPTDASSHYKPLDCRVLLLAY